jgi:hypothetical protein
MVSYRPMALCVCVLDIQVYVRPRRVLICPVPNVHPNPTQPNLLEFDNRKKVPIRRQRKRKEEKTKKQFLNKKKETRQSGMRAC